jgi:hypothetical protein
MTDQTEATASTDGLPVETLRALVELQRTELNRLLRDHARLNDRIDTLIQLHEREQVLRQQMQASLDQLTQAQIESSRQGPRLTHDATPDMATLQARLERTEHRFSALQDAVGRLIGHIERKTVAGLGRDHDQEPGGGFVRVFAPG